MHFSCTLMNINIKAFSFAGMHEPVMQVSLMLRFLHKTKCCRFSAVLTASTTLHLDSLWISKWHGNSREMFFLLIYLLWLSLVHKEIVIIHVVGIFWKYFQDWKPVYLSYTHKVDILRKWRVTIVHLLHGGKCFVFSKDSWLCCSVWYEWTIKLYFSGCQTWSFIPLVFSVTLYVSQYLLMLWDHLL